jgi:hypothetical protein
MRHLLGGVALAALLAAGLPAAAQNSSKTQPTTPPAASDQGGMSQSPAASDETGASTKAKGKHAGRHHTMASNRGASEDNIAEELNRQELQKLQQGAPSSGTSGEPSMNAQPGTGAGATAPDNTMAPKQ